MGTSHNCRSNRRCRICGKPDYCNWVEFPNGDTLEYCHRVTGNIGDTTVGKDGAMYVLKRITKQGFSVWESSEQHERNRKEFIEKLKAEGKEPVPRKERKGRMVENAAALPETVKAANSARKADPSRLDEVFRTFLSLLVLEEKHKDILRLEWDEKMRSEVCERWHIKSVPPEDRLRFSSTERLNNKSRKKIMEELVSKVGEPSGVPGFYRRKDGLWTFCYLCGIAYPIMNTHGQIIGLEIANDYPKVEDGDSLYRYQLSDGVAGWYRIPRAGEDYDYSRASLVWEFGGKNNIELTRKNLPKGKVTGKYKPFFSERIKTVDGRVVNIYDQGCSGGSPASLYAKKGDDFSAVYVTEGAKKAIVANYVLNVPVVMLSGVGKFRTIFEKEDGYTTTVTEELLKKGMRILVIAFDADKNSNILVLKAEENFVKEALETGLKVAVAEWNAAWGKGLDDILLTGVMPQVMIAA